VMSNGNRTAPNTYSGALYRTTGPAFSSVPWDASKIVATQAGTGTFTFADSRSGTFAYTLDGTTQSKAITRQLFGNPTTTCRPN
jgi:hypothetical protein